MKFERTFLRSKVARRIFMLFIFCALLPIAVLAILSFGWVTKQLKEQSHERLHQSSKAMGMDIFKRLSFLEEEMKMVASNLRASSRPILPAPPEEFSEHLKERFNGFELITDTDSYMPLFGRIPNSPKLTPENGQDILSGKTLVFTEYYPDHSCRIYMSIALGPENPRREILLAEIEAMFLWFMSEDEDVLLPATELCILDQSNNVLYSSLPAPTSFPERVTAKMTQNTYGQFEWLHEEEEYLASFREVFLASKFLTNKKWIVVLSESKDYVLKPIGLFKLIFLLVILLSLWIVSLLSFSQIRRSLIPLEKLKEGTQRIARRDFDSRVTVTSRDEFEELAASFNTMASQLGRQFKTLTTMAEIDRAILSSLDTAKIVDTVLTRMRELFPCNSVSVTLLNSEDSERAQIYVGDDKIDKGKHVATIELKPEEMQKLHKNPETLLIEEPDEDPPSYLVPLASRGIKSFLVLPIFLKQKLAGIITLGYLEPPDLTQEDLDQARQLAGQVAVALSNARLIEELDLLNWGTLRALARTIDAKSHWTAGHSERSTRLALQIGRVLGLTSEETTILHRGGLLHDIGKLGVPPDILDKPGKLTAEEKELMEKHVRLGARILEPIAAYAEVIPIVLHHHEGFDGTGYPDGLAGEAISLNARIFAVADTFEALTSNRPYRKAFNRKRAVEYIKQNAGKVFDPKVVQAFLEVMAQDEREQEGQ